MAIDGQGTLAARPVSTVGSPGKRGRYYFATDTNQVFRDFGTGWVEVGDSAFNVIAENEFGIGANAAGDYGCITGGTGAAASGTNAQWSPIWIDPAKYAVAGK